MWGLSCTKDNFHAFGVFGICLKPIVFIDWSALAWWCGQYHTGLLYFLRIFFQFKLDWPGSLGQNYFWPILPYLTLNPWHELMALKPWNWTHGIEPMARPCDLHASWVYLSYKLLCYKKYDSVWKKTVRSLKQCRQRRGIEVRILCTKNTIHHASFSSPGCTTSLFIQSFPDAIYPLCFFILFR